jgi:excisionase family DNA binding protein
MTTTTSITTTVTAAPPKTSTLMTISEVAQALGLGKQVVRIMSKNGRFLAPIMLGVRAPRWRAEDVQAWIDARVPK